MNRVMRQQYDNCGCYQTESNQHRATKHNTILSWCHTTLLMALFFLFWNSYDLVCAISGYINVLDYYSFLWFSVNQSTVSLVIQGNGTLNVCWRGNRMASECLGFVVVQIPLVSTELVLTPSGLGWQKMFFAVTQFFCRVKMSKLVTLVIDTTEWCRLALQHTFDVLLL